MHLESKNHIVRVRLVIYTLHKSEVADIALWLGSFAALFAVPLIALSMIPRITEEEKTLTGALNGYKHYKKKVKYRIIPFVW